jgi:hypothetical protein
MNRRKMWSIFASRWSRFVAEAKNKGSCGVASLNINFYGVALAVEGATLNKLDQVSFLDSEAPGNHPCRN